MDSLPIQLKLGSATADHQRREYPCHNRAKRPKMSSDPGFVKVWDFPVVLFFLLFKAMHLAVDLFSPPPPSLSLLLKFTQFHRTTSRLRGCTLSVRGRNESNSSKQESEQREEQSGLFPRIQVESDDRAFSVNVSVKFIARSKQKTSHEPFRRTVFIYLTSL